MPMVVMLDTNALLWGSRSASDALARLSRLNLVIVYLSAVSVEERRLAIEDAILEASKSAQAAVSKYRREAGKAGGDLFAKVSELSSNCKGIASEMIAKAAQDRVDKGIEDLHARVLLVDDADGQTALDAYFSGAAPYRHRKCREDMPDSFIYLAARRLQEKSPKTIVHFIGADKQLQASLEKLNGFKLYSNLESWLSNKEVRKLQRLAAATEQWHICYSKMRDALEDDQRLIGLIQDELFDQLVNWGTVDASYPDRNEAAIDTVETPTDINLDWDDRYEVDQGVVSIPFTADVEMSVLFGAHMGDAFGVPRNVRIPMPEGDDPWVEGSASFVATVHGAATIEISEDDIKLADWSNAHVDVEIDSIEVPEYEYGEPDEDPYA